MFKNKDTFLLDFHRLGFELTHITSNGNKSRILRIDRKGCIYFSAKSDSWSPGKFFSAKSESWPVSSHIFAVSECTHVLSDGKDIQFMIFFDKSKLNLSSTGDSLGFFATKCFDVLDLPLSMTMCVVFMNINHILTCHES